MLAWTIAAMVVGSTMPGSAMGAAVTITSSKFGNLFHDTEPATFDVNVISGFASVDGVLVTDVQDPYGRVVLHDQHPVSIVWSSATRSLTIGSALKGRFAVTAKLYDRALTEPPLVSVQSAIGIVAPPPTPGFDDRSAVGYFVLPSEGDPFDETPNADLIARQMQDLGVKWVRYGYRWGTDTRRDRPNTADPAWLDTSRYETWVDAYRAHGIKVMGNLSGSARWASTQPDDEREILFHGESVGLGPIWAAATPVADDWALFVRTMQERLLGRIDDWEIWNEPDGYLFYEPALVLAPAVAAQRFGDLVALSKATLAAVNPDARVIVSFSNSGNLPFESSVVPRAGPSLDAFGFHYGEALAVTYARFIFSLYGVPPKPFWNTEAFGGTRDALPRWIHQRAAGATRIFPYIWAFFQVGNPVYFGVSPLGPSYTPEALALAVRTLSDEIGHADFVRTFPILGQPGINGYVFVDGSRTVIVVLREDPEVDVWAPAQPTLQLVVKVPVGTPNVRVLDGMGNATTLVPNAGQVRLPLDGNPVYVEGVAAIAPQPLEFVALITAACGNGRVDPGEECDDGNTTDGDSCSNACIFACPATPKSGCMPPSRASLVVKTKPLAPASNKLLFKWAGPLPGPGLGDPFATTSYAFCLYDAGTVGPPRVVTIAAAPGGTCRGRPCWTGKPTSYTYSDRTRTADGLKTLQVKASLDGSSSLKLAASGDRLQLNVMPLAPPVIAQVRATNGSCWNSVFADAITHSDANIFSARADMLP